MRSFEEKLTVLKKGKLLSGSGLFISEDLLKEEREKRKVLVRSQGKKPYIRHADGQLIINGKLHDESVDSDQLYHVL